MKSQRFNPALVQKLLNLALSQPQSLGLSFYRRLFAAAPGLRTMFPEDMEAQRDKLVRTLASLASALDDEPRTAHMLANLGARHAVYGALPEHYPAVGRILAEVFSEVLNRPLTDEEERSWNGFYDWIAEGMLQGAR